MESIGKYLKQHMWLQYHVKKWFYVGEEKGISIAVFQGDIKPRWRSLSFWIGRVSEWVLTSASMRRCVSRQEVHSMCLQHDLLKAVSKTPTYLLPQLGMLTRWRMNGDESNCGRTQSFSVLCGPTGRQGVVWIKEGLCARGRTIKNLIRFNFRDLKNRHQVWKAVDPWRNAVGGTHQLSIY